MKKLSVACLLLALFLMSSVLAAGCRKAEQKPREQAPVMVDGFQLIGGNLEKSGMGFILTTEKDKNATAIKKTSSAFKNVIRVKGRIKSPLDTGVRNGMIVFGENSNRLAQAVIFIGAKSMAIQGPFVEKAEKPLQLDQAKVLDAELTVNLEEGTVAWKVDGMEVKTRMTERPASINYIGYGAWNTKTEFSELQVSGD